MSKPQALCLHTDQVMRLLYTCNTQQLPATGITLLDHASAKNFIHALGTLTDEVWYIPRSNCETNFDFRQLLPYVVFVDHNGNILCYNRPAKNGGEERLAGNFSIGFGGHVEIQDWTDNPWFTCFNAVERELREELYMEDTGNGVDPMNTMYHTLTALILSDDTPVDSAHLGLVLVSKWPSVGNTPCQIVSNEPDQICNLRALTLEEAKAEANPESWTTKILTSGILEQFM